MPADFSITVGEILQSPHFKNAVLVAGDAGVNSPVKWVHILEARKNIDQLVNGYELVLTTGVCLLNEEMACNFMQQLIDQRVSGLCIELGTYFSEIPDSMLRMADENQFPLIVFKNITRFIDITHALHTMIISRNSEMFSRVEDFYQELNKLLLSAHEFSDLLNFAHQYLKLNVVFIPASGEPIFVPNITSDRQRKLLAKVKNGAARSENNLASGHELIEEAAIAGRRIIAVNQDWGDLYFFADQSALTEFDRVILGKCAVAVAQDISRELYSNEKKVLEENSWVENWLKGECHEDEIYRRLIIFGAGIKIKGYCACLFQLDTNGSSTKIKETMIHATIFARPIFEKNGFQLINSLDRNEMAYVLLDRGSAATWIERVKTAVAELKDGRHSFFTDTLTHCGIGKRLESVDELHKSMETAQEAIAIQKNLEIDQPVYDQLHVYRLIKKLDRMNFLNEFMHDYLEPIIQYDAHNQSDLLKTLQVFYACNCSKQKTAERLFVVRQTMYFRLQKISDLLGEDFMSGEKRVAIECALYAYDYLKKNQRIDRWQNPMPDPAGTAQKNPKAAFFEQRR